MKPEIVLSGFLSLDEADAKSNLLFRLGLG